MSNLLGLLFLFLSFFFMSILMSVNDTSRCMSDHSSFLVSNDILNFKFLPFDCTFGNRFNVVLLKLLIMWCYFSLLLLLAHFKFYEAILALIFVRITWRWPPKKGKRNKLRMVCKLLLVSFCFLFIFILKLAVAMRSHLTSIFLCVQFWLFHKDPRRV